MRIARSSSRLLGWGVGGVCLSACWRPPPVWAWRPTRSGPGSPPGCGPGDPPQARPLNFPLGVGLETPPGQTPQLPTRCGPGDPPRPDPSTSPWVWAWRPTRHAGIPPLPLETCMACWDTTPPCGQNDRHVQKHNLRKLRLRAVIKPFCRKRSIYTIQSTQKNTCNRFWLFKLDMILALRKLDRDFGMVLTLNTASLNGILIGM